MEVARDKEREKMLLLLRRTDTSAKRKDPFDHPARLPTETKTHLNLSAPEPYKVAQLSVAGIAHPEKFETTKIPHKRERETFANFDFGDFAQPNQKLNRSLFFHRPFEFIIVKKALRPSFS